VLYILLGRTGAFYFLETPLCLTNPILDEHAGGISLLVQDPKLSLVISLDPTALGNLAKEKRDGTHGIQSLSKNTLIQAHVYYCPQVQEM